MIVCLSTTVVGSARSVANPVVGAEQPADDWNPVKSIAVQTRVRLQDINQHWIEGKLDHVDDDGISIQMAGKIVKNPRHLVRRIERAVGRRSSHGAKLGFAEGALAGAAIAAVSVKSNRGYWIPFLSLSWGAIGALIGAIDGASQFEYVVVYEVTTR